MAAIQYMAMRRGIVDIPAGLLSPQRDPVIKDKEKDTQILIRCVGRRFGKAHDGMSDGMINDRVLRNLDTICCWRNAGASVSRMIATR